MGEYAEKIVIAPVHSGRRGEDASEISTNEILKAYREGNLNRSFPLIGFPAEKTPGQARASRQAPIEAILQHYEEDMHRHAPETHAHTAVLQGKLYKDPSNMKALVEAQRELQTKTDGDLEAALETDQFTTVGFEHEFGQLQDGNSVLHNLTHLELAESDKFIYSDLPFSLETDAADAIELVSPPFIMATDEHGVPETADVVAADTMMKAGLTSLLTTPVKFSNLKANFASRLGISFKSKDAMVKKHHVKPGLSDALKDRLKPPAPGRPVATVPAASPGSAGGGAPPKRDKVTVSAATADKLEIKLSAKGGGITSQANIAMDAEAYIRAGKAVKSRLKPDNKIATGFTAIQNKIAAFIRTKCGGQAFTEIEQSLLEEIATNLSQCLIVVPMEKVMEIKDKIFQGGEPVKKEEDDYKRMNRVASYVKDVSGVWLKDTILSLCAGVLKDQEQKDKFKTVFEAVQTDIETLHTDLQKEVDERVWMSIFGSRPVPVYLKYTAAMKDKIDNSITVLLNYFQSTVPGVPELDVYDRPEFMGYDPALLGGRQDTFIPQSKLKKATAFADRRMYVVEVRNHDLQASLEAIRTGNWSDTPAAAGGAKKGRKKRRVRRIAKNVKVRGAEEHIERMEKGRKNK